MKHYFSLIFSLLLLLTSCEKKSDHTLKIAATSIPHAEILEFVKPELKAKGIDLDIIVVEDFNTPNRALQDKEVDANFFQHLPSWKPRKKILVISWRAWVGVHLEPMGLYSKRIKALDELKDKATVAIPNDPTNQARALLLLQQNGLIKLSKEGVTASVHDVVENPKQLQFMEIDPALLSRTLEDVDLAAITTNFALQAGLRPEKDALALENGSSLFTNIVVVRKGEWGRADLQALKEALTSDSVKRFMKEKYKGAVVSPTPD